MRTETVVCDRCKRDARSVPDVMDADGLTFGGFTLNMPGRGLDLCPECFVAFRAWVALGEAE